MVSCPPNVLTNLLVLFAVGCVAFPRVVSATGGFETRPYKSSRRRRQKVLRIFMDAFGGQNSIWGTEHYIRQFG